MTKRVLDVGNCAPDHAAIRRLVEGNFDAQVVQAHGPQDALKQLRSGQFELVIVNRKLDRDYSDGMEIIKQIKDDPQLSAVPVMLLTNYPEHQQAAMEIGAEMGFGKLEYGRPETKEKLGRFLA
jgi:two-component system chemotaxis response regulator CheY